MHAYSIRKHFYSFHSHGNLFYQLLSRFYQLHSHGNLFVINIHELCNIFERAYFKVV